MELGNIEKRSWRSSISKDISWTIRNVLKILENFHPEWDGIEVLVTPYLFASIPKDINKDHVKRIAEIVTLGFKSLPLNKEIPADCVLKSLPYTPKVDALDLAIELANNEERDIYLAFGNEDICIQIPSGLKGGVDKENTDSDALILADALDKGFKISKFIIGDIDSDE